MDRTARTLHAFLFASTLIVSAGAFVVTRTTGPLAGGVTSLELVALLVGATSLTLVFLLRAQLPPRASGQSLDDWWRLALGKAMLLWGLLEFPALLGAVTLFATRRPTGFGLLVLAALSGLIMLSPARLAGE